MTLDIVVLALYALGMLVLGWFGMRRSRNQEDYLVAGRNLGPAMYMSTMAATVLGGASTIGSVRLGYVHGIFGAVAVRDDRRRHHHPQPAAREAAHQASHLHGHAGARTAIQPRDAPGERGCDVRVRVDDRCRVDTRHQHRDAGFPEAALLCLRFC